MFIFSVQIHKKAYVPTSTLLLINRSAYIKHTRKFPFHFHKGVVLFNPLFFGHFAYLGLEEFKKEYSKRLLQDSRTYDAIVGDIYGMGRVLATNKFKWLKRSYQTFLIGLISAISVFSLMEFVPYFISLLDFEVIAE